MKFECKSGTLVSSVSSVSKARSKQVSQSYLQDIYIELDNHLLTLRSTNLEISCEKSVSVKGIQNGKCIVKGDTFVKIIQILQTQDETLTCELIDGIFSITRKTGLIEIKTTPYEDFPTLPTQGDLIGVLPAATITNILKDVSFCAATTEIKPEIASIYLYTQGKELIAVATDSYRLAEKIININQQLSFSLLIPQKYLSEIISILTEEQENITLYLNEGILTCVSGTGLTLCIHIITGQFPDYKQLFPKTFTTNIQIEKNDLYKTLTLTTYFTENYSQVKCVFANNTLTVHSRSESIGQTTNTIPTKQEGNDIEVTYNNRYFLDVLPYFKGNTVNLSFTTPNRPVFISDKENKSFTYLLMPLVR